MTTVFKKIIKNQKGAMENILVVLLLVIIGVGALILFSSWSSEEETKMKDATTTKIEKTLSDANK